MVEIKYTAGSNGENPIGIPKWPCSLFGICSATWFNRLCLHVFGGASIISNYPFVTDWLATIITWKNRIQGTSYQISICQGHFHFPVNPLPKLLLPAMPPLSLALLWIVTIIFLFLYFFLKRFLSFPRAQILSLILLWYEEIWHQRIWNIMYWYSNFIYWFKGSLIKTRYQNIKKIGKGQWRPLWISASG